MAEREAGGLDARGVVPLAGEEIRMAFADAKLPENSSGNLRSIEIVRLV
jgi:hypothetical protein